MKNTRLEVSTEARTKEFYMNQITEHDERLTTGWQQVNKRISSGDMAALCSRLSTSGTAYPFHARHVQEHISMGGLGQTNNSRVLPGATRQGSVGQSGVGQQSWISPEAGRAESRLLVKLRNRIHSCHILPFQPILWNKYFPPEPAKTAKHSPKSMSEEGRIWQAWHHGELLVKLRNSI